MLELTFQKSREENEKSGSAGVGVNTAIKQKQNKKNRQKDRLRMEKNGREEEGGHTGSHLQFMTTSRAKTRRLEKEGVDGVPI